MSYSSYRYIFITGRVDILNCDFSFFRSNFSVKLVVLFRDKLVKAREVLAAGHQPRPVMETIIVTLAHLSLHSEKIELEVFVS